MTTECAYCHRARNLPPGITLCTLCLQDLEDLLTAIPETLTDVDTTITRQNVALRPGQNISAPSDETPEPLNWTAADRARDLHHALQAWCNTLEGDHGPGTGHHPAERLQSLTPEIRLADYAGQLLDELNDAHRRVLAATDLPPDLITLGGCGHINDNEGEGVPCPGTVRAHQGRHEARCDTCGTTYGVAERQQAAIADAWDHHRPLSVVVKALQLAGFHIKIKTAQWWVQQGDLRTPWQSPDGTALYTMAQVYDVHQAKQAQGRRKHARRRTSRAA